jgi:2-C-methyl-D-erythritol 2,4-cyclodiphosphate synthase
VSFRVGIGYDLHRLGPGSGLRIGGVSIPSDSALIGHSDGDVLVHAIIDALLGACGLGNIGERFPDTDPAWKGADSLRLLSVVQGLVRESGYRVGNVDSNVLAERPKLAGQFPAMRAAIAGALGVPVTDVSVKAKTMEGVDAVGRGEAIAAEAVALVFAEE